MKIKSENLKQCLQYISSIYKRTHVMETTKHFIVNADSGVATFIYFDGEREVSVSCDIETQDAEHFCVEFDKLNQKMKLAQDGVVVSLSFKGDSVTLVVGKSRTKVGSFNVEAYPRFKVDPDGVLVKCLSSDIANGISKVSNVIPSNDSRPYLNGLCFDVEKGKMTVVGSDGQRLSMSEIIVDYSDNSSFSSILPKNSISAFVSVLDSEEVEIFFTDSKIMAKSGKKILMVPKKEGKYANWRQALGMSKTCKSADFNVSELKYAIRSALITSNHMLGGIEIEISKGVTNFMSKDESGETFEPIESNSDFDYRFAISGNYLNQAISNIESGVVSICTTSEDPNQHRPIKITENNYTSIIMPIKM